jgi:NADPH-dependent 2,4-dienoyl-CoA reductase/sulfur reductase-like enzyme
MLQRRTLLKSYAALAAAGPTFVTHAAGPAQASALTQNALQSAHVVIVGAGYGGTTAAKYIRLLSNFNTTVTLIEPDPLFVSCPLSNLVISGYKDLGEVSLSYKDLVSRYGIQMIVDRVISIDTEKRLVRTKNNSTFSYDSLILSPGVELMREQIEGLQAAKSSGDLVQAWGTPGEIELLKNQIQSIPNGGVFAISVPELPYRCPPGPYERASLVAHYFKTQKPKSKVIILDANQDVTSKGALFKKFWLENYPAHLEYRPEHRVLEVDARSRTLKFEIQEDLTADVINVLPPMRAGSIAHTSGLTNVNKRWCEVDFLTFESTVAKHVHVLGDSIQTGPYMPKSAHMANAHAKVCAASIVARLLDTPPNPTPWLTNTCYSFVSPTQSIYIASVHQYDPAEKTFKILPGAGGMSGPASQREGQYALGWAQNIWNDCLG